MSDDVIEIVDQVVEVIEVVERGLPGPPGADSTVPGPQGIQGLQGDPGSDADATAAIETHRGDTTDVHGIADTSALVLGSELAAEATAREGADTALDTRLDSAESGGVVLPWLANRVYKAGQLMTQAGATWTRNADGTSRASFDATELALWTVLPFQQGVELAYAERTSNHAATSAFADVTGLSITFTPRDRPFMVVSEFYVQKDATASYVWGQIAKGATEVGRDVKSVIASGFTSLRIAARRTDVAGVPVTYRTILQAGAGAATVQGGATYKPFIQAYEI